MDIQFFKFCAYGFLKNLTFFEPFLFVYLTGAGLSYLAIGTLIAIRETSTILLEVPTGFLADSWGRRRSMLLSFGSYISSFLVFWAFPRFWPCALAMVLFGLGEAFRTGTHKAMILEHLRLRGLTALKTAYYGSTRAWSQVGSAVSAVAGGALVIIAGDRGIVFLGSVFPYLVGLFLLSTYPAELEGSSEETDGNPVGRDGSSGDAGWTGQMERGVTGDVAAQDSSFGPSAGFREIREDFLGMLGSEKARKAILNSALFDGAFKSVKDYLQPMLLSIALSLSLFEGAGRNQGIVLISLVYFVLYVLTSFGAGSAGRLAGWAGGDYNAANLTYLAGMGVTLAAGAAYLGFGSGGRIFETIGAVMFVCLFVLQNARRPVCVSIVSSAVPGRATATGLSLESLVKAAVVAAWSPVAGYTADNAGIGCALILTAAASLAAYPFVRMRGLHN